MEIIFSESQWVSDNIDGEKSYYIPVKKEVDQMPMVSVLRKVTDTEFHLVHPELTYSTDFFFIRASEPFDGMMLLR